MKKLVPFVALISLTLAAGGEPFVWGVTPGFDFEDTQNPVEQQTQGGAGQPDHSLWVVNNTGCAWDSDDKRAMSDLQGNIGPGVSAVGTKCIIADWNDHGIYLNVNARSPNLVATVSFAPQGSSFTITAPPHAEGNRYVYEVCARAIRYDRSSPDLQPIPNSGFGGVGVMTTVTVTLRNPTTRTERDVGAYFRLANTPAIASAGRCADSLPNRIGSFPGPIMEWGIP